ncbi:MFS transporter [Novosphingobium sp. KCTC 2891]|uniref:MFS transporter n=1 Tax=Novosphingobium sp. KCTC 2891 TaxID=2989730 RepID=UPI0022228874|nr:MFS transporter [Novosphingobium sp. KCTC 2891]MCW1382358.1 MFS transporter [Novosphingobium sp. KCTC 2891]
MATASADMRAGGGGRAGAVRALVLLLAVAVLLNFVDRGALGIAAPKMKADLGLSATTFGLAASAFFWTYAAMQPLLGWLSDRISVYKVLAFALALWALSTMLTGLVGGLASLIVLRLLLGLGESFVFPCTSKLIARHVGPAQRGTANAVVAVGLALGPALGTLAGGAILARWGWQAVFAAFGAVTLAWLVPWFFVVRALPDVGRSAAPQGLSYAGLLRQRALWITGACHVTANYAFFFVSIWLPLYLVNSRGLSIGTMAWFAAATYGAQAAASLFFGHASDRMVRAGRDEDTVRRAFSVGGQVALAVGIVGIAMAPGQASLLGWLVFTGLAMGIGPTMTYAIGQIFAGERLAGSWIGWQNAIGSLSGVAGPLITGLIVDASGGFAGAFAFAAAISLLGAVLFQWVLPPIRPIGIGLATGKGSAPA